MLLSSLQKFDEKLSSQSRIENNGEIKKQIISAISKLGHVR